MMKKIPNGKKIIRQEIEKRMRMLEELNNKVASQTAVQKVIGALQQNTQCSVATDRIADAFNKCGNKSFFVDQLIEGQGLQGSPQG